MFVLVCNSSICYPQCDTRATHWQGRVPLRCTRVRDKRSKQSWPRFCKCGNFLERQINTDPGSGAWRERERLRAEGWRRGGFRIIQQQLSSVSPEQESREVEKVINLSFCTFLLSPAALPSPSQSTMEGVSRLARSSVRTGITFTHFLWQGKLQLHGSVCLRLETFFDGSMSDWGLRKRSFFFHATVKFTRCSTRFAQREDGAAKQENPDKNKIQQRMYLFLINGVTSSATVTSNS